MTDNRPRLLDLFCKAGGATQGYKEAGFHVTGVDIEPQPNYVGDEFVQADALTFPLDGYDAIHASPPCQAFSKARQLQGREHPDLLTPIRRRLEAWGGLWVIENVPGAPMRPDLLLCGSMFPQLRDGEYGTIRHRWFELSFQFTAPVPLCDHPPKVVSVFGHGGRNYMGVEQWRRVMGIEWMTRNELAEAIPPPFTRFIGGLLMKELAPRRLAA